MCTRRELQYWLGLTRADLFGYLASLLTIVLFVARGPIYEMLLAAAAIALTTASFAIGWRNDPEGSDFTNAVILIAYPCWSFLIVGAVAMHFLVG